MYKYTYIILYLLNLLREDLKNPMQANAYTVFAFLSLIFFSDLS